MSEVLVNKIVKVKIFTYYIVYIKNSGASGMSYELVRGVENLQVEYATVSNNVYNLE